jgi:putative flippase GtrA
MAIIEMFDRKLLRFILVGIVNTIVGSAIMFLLYNAVHLSYWVSSACNYGVTGILSFFLNKYVTFGVKRWSVFMVAAFILTIVASYLLAYGVAKPLVNTVLQGSPEKVRENIALFTGMCLFTGLNYLGQRLIVFKPQASFRVESRRSG